MAVVTLYMSDRDQSKTFSDKKEADNYDKMLELAENVSLWMERSVEGLNETQTEAIGLLLARNKDKLLLALKGKPEQLLETEKAETDNDEKVTSISASA